MVCGNFTLNTSLISLKRRFVGDLIIHDVNYYWTVQSVWPKCCCELWVHSSICLQSDSTQAFLGHTAMTHSCLNSVSSSEKDICTGSHLALVPASHPVSPHPLGLICLSALGVLSASRFWNPALFHTHCLQFTCLGGGAEKEVCRQNHLPFAWWKVQACPAPPPEIQNSTSSARLPVLIPPGLQSIFLQDSRQNDLSKKQSW